MRYLCITVDLDRDVNIPVRGSSAAGSIDRGAGTSPRFSSSGKGAELLVELFDSLGVKATFFAEARTLHRSGAFNFVKGHEVAMHGLDHEDFTGERTGMGYDYGDLREITERSISLIRDCIGMNPKGFRSPYTSPNEDMLSFLSEYGIVYDSSYYTYAGDSILPYRSEYGITEIPVPKSVDRSGEPITGYLWPMHEGTRDKEDFIDMADSLNEGVFVIATHSWHVCENQKGMLDDAGVKRNIDDIRSIVETLMDRGFDVISMYDASRIV